MSATFTMSDLSTAFAYLFGSITLDKSAEEIAIALAIFIEEENAGSILPPSILLKLIVLILTAGGLPLGLVLGLCVGS